MKEYLSRNVRLGELQSTLNYMTSQEWELFSITAMADMTVTLVFMRTKT